MLHYLQYLVTLACISSVSSAFTANGLSSPSSITPIIGKSSPKTDFTRIFSSILSFESRKKATPNHTFDERDTITPPQFFAESFGPVNAANNADGYMGFTMLTTYDVNACAQICNTRAFDATSGPCIFFNIWQSVVNGTGSAAICSLYNTVTDSSTATNTGQGNLKVSLSRGFNRISNLQDGSFQDYTCVVTANNGCSVTPSNFWVRTVVEPWDFALVLNWPAHSGTSACEFFFNPPAGFVLPSNAGATLSYTQPFNTTQGKKYILSFFYTQSDFGTIGQPLPTNAHGVLFSVFWNNVKVLDVMQVNPLASLQYLHAQVEVTATGPAVDTLFFKNGITFSYQAFLDDVAVFEKWF